MNLKQAKRGEHYRIFLTSDKKLSKQPTQYTTTATIIAEAKAGTSVLLGWKPGDNYPIDANPRTGTSTENDYIPDQSIYKYGKSVSRDFLVAIQIFGGLDGFPCAQCKEFYPYAEPNQTNGTLICYRCRTGW